MFSVPKLKRFCVDIFTDDYPCGHFALRLGCYRDSDLQPVAAKPAPSPQVPPEEPTHEWLTREAHNGVDQRASKKYGGHSGR